MSAPARDREAENTRRFLALHATVLAALDEVLVLGKEIGAYQQEQAPPTAPVLRLVHSGEASC